MSKRIDYERTRAWRRNLINAAGVNLSRRPRGIPLGWYENAHGNFSMLHTELHFSVWKNADGWHWTRARVRKSRPIYDGTQATSPETYPTPAEAIAAATDFRANDASKSPDATELQNQT